MKQNRKSIRPGMDLDFAFLSRTALFLGASPEETEAILTCLAAETRTYEKGQMIYRAGDTAVSLGLVLSGRILIVHDDFWGNTTVLDSAGPGQIFAETYACTPGEPMMVNAEAAEDSRVLFLNVSRTLRTCSRSCEHHSRLIRNLLALSARKNLNLSRKIFYTASKSVRGRLLAYLSDQVVRSGSHSFTIPFNRQQLADYLNVDRSALSKEIGRLQKEGLLKTRKNWFEMRMRELLE